MTEKPRKPVPEVYDDDDDDDEAPVARPKTPPRPRTPPPAAEYEAPAGSGGGQHGGAGSRDSVPVSPSGHYAPPQSIPLMPEMPPEHNADVGTSDAERQFQEAEPSARILPFKKKGFTEQMTHRGPGPRTAPMATPEQRYTAARQATETATTTMAPPQQHVRRQPVRSAQTVTPEQRFVAARQEATMAPMAPPQRRAATPAPTPMQEASAPTQEESMAPMPMPSQEAAMVPELMPMEDQPIEPRPVRRRGMNPMKVVGMAFLFFAGAYALSRWGSDEEEEEESDPDGIPEVDVPELEGFETDTTEEEEEDDEDDDDDEPAKLGGDDDDDTIDGEIVAA